MRRKTLAILIFIGAPTMAALFQNCGQPTTLEFASSEDLSSSAGLESASLKILNTKCSSCHNPNSASGNLTDITNVAYLQWARQIVAGEPELSPVIIRITRGEMPPGEFMSGTDVDILKRWIASMDPQNLGPGGGAPVSVIIAPKYSVLAQVVFSPKCVACHANRNYKLNSYTEVLRSVTDGKLYDSLTRTTNRMPQGGSLTATELKAIADWIAAGAPNN